ncbi:MULTISPECIES: hypothetical protein [unclassified Endozoicomonas]|uniref:hypothetical protein n=1 Tax=unclassified Endozoicomonas TaxID=2644528 RepID=UPI003BB79FF8
MKAGKTRPLRIQTAGALYHVTSRGEAIIFAYQSGSYSLIEIADLEQEAALFAR